MISSLLDLFFPSLCDLCGHYRPASLECLCLKCRMQLHRTNYHRRTHNPVERHFWGRIPLQKATAFLHFSAAGSCRKLIHQLKYQNRPDIGIFLGKLCGRELVEAGFFDQIDLILPIPLHHKKLKKRGYNQAACLAEGIALGCGIPFDADLLVKEENTQSQTTKSRYERYLNVKTSFQIRDLSLIKGKHLLLVDDVITTGSTLEACGLAILNEADCCLSVLTLAATD